VSFVPGVAFFAASPMHHALRLSFVTEPAERIAQGVATLAQVVRRALATQSGQAQ
jgi:DNA-binding transcriptional MocR family regulator